MDDISQLKKDVAEIKEMLKSMNVDTHKMSDHIDTVQSLIHAAKRFIPGGTRTAPVRSQPN